MPLPKDHEWPAGEKPLCAGKLRNKSRGCGKPNTCTLNHDPASSWSAVLMEFMKQWVDKHACLAWNPFVVTPEMIGMAYSKSPSKVDKK